MSRESLPGARRFTWYTPASGAPTDYEDLTVHYQQSPAHYAVQGWPIRFDDGRDPFIAESTRLRSSDWYAFRDPDALVSRRYFAELAEDEASLERALAASTPGTRLKSAGANWVSRGLSSDLAAYPFYEHGLFISLSYAEREALSDTVTFATVFSAADRLRALQDVVRYSFELENLPGYRDDGRATWEKDPAWQGVRRVTEHLLATRDWLEVIVAGLLIVDVVVGDVLRLGLFDAVATASGDSVTPRVLSATLADVARGRRWVRALVHALVSDPVHASHNKAILTEWSKLWGEEAEAAGHALAGAFSAADRASLHSPALTAALGHKRALLAEIEGAP